MTRKLDNAATVLGTAIKHARKDRANSLAGPRRLDNGAIVQLRHLGNNVYAEINGNRTGIHIGHLKDLRDETTLRSVLREIKNPDTSTELGEKVAERKEVAAVTDTLIGAYQAHGLNETFVDKLVSAGVEKDTIHEALEDWEVRLGYK